MPSSMFNYFLIDSEADSLAQRSLRALSCSFFGRSQKSDKVLRMGNEIYLNCLREINTRLADPSLCTSTDVLLAVSVFGFYECLLLTAQSAWIKHYMGLARMLELAGPAACKDDMFSQILRQNRFMMILAAMATQSSTFLSDPEWKYYPEDMPRDSMDDLLDIVADLPKIRTGNKIAKHSLSILVRLEQWHDFWRDTLDAQLASQPMTDSDYPKTWQDPIISCDVYKANHICIYNAAVIMAIDHALQSAHVHDLEPGSASVLYYRRYESAVGICRLSNYFLSNQDVLGGLFILWPLRMAAKVFKSGYEEEMRWLKQKVVPQIRSGVIWEIQQETFQDYT